MNYEHKGGPGPLAAIHEQLAQQSKDLDSFQDRMDDIEQRMTDELAKLEQRITGARPDADPEAQARVGEALGVEDRTQLPPWAKLWQDDDGDWYWDPKCTAEVSLFPTMGDAIDNAWLADDVITAPLRAECERLRANVDEWRERAEKAEAALAEALKRGTRIDTREVPDGYMLVHYPDDTWGVGIREIPGDPTRENAIDSAITHFGHVTNRLSDENRRLQAALADWAVAHQKQRDIIASNVVLTDRLRRQADNARRSTIKELVRRFHLPEEVADWLRSQLDTEPTEQPTVCPRCDGNDNEPGSMTDCDLCGGATEQPTESPDGDWLGQKHDRPAGGDPGRSRIANASAIAQAREEGRREGAREERERCAADLRREAEWMQERALSGRGIVERCISLVTDPHPEPSEAPGKDEPQP